MRRLEELLRQMCQAAKAIGNTELENKFAEGNDNNKIIIIITILRIKWKIHDKLFMRMPDINMEQLFNWCARI